MEPNNCFPRFACRRVLRVIFFARRGIDNIVVHHIAACRAKLHIRPVFIAFQHGQRLTVAQSGKHGGVGRRCSAQVERLALVRKGDRRHADAVRRGWRRFLAIPLNGQIAGHHIAGERAILDTAPFTHLFQQIDLRAVRHLRQNRGCYARLLAQIQAVQRVLQRDDRDLRIGHRLVRRLRRAIDSGEQRARHRVACARQPRIVKVKDLVVSHALVRHLLRTALTHADAVTKAPRRQFVAADGFRNRQRLVFQHVDGHRAKPFDLREIIQRDRHIAVTLQRHADQHLIIDPRRRAVPRFIQRNEVDGLDLYALRADQRRRLRPQKLSQRGNARRAVAVKGHGFSDGRAVAQIVWVVLDLKIAV